MTSALFFIPLLPFVGFLLNGLLGMRLPRPVVSLIAIAGPALAWVISTLAFLEIAGGAEGTTRTLAFSLGDWIRAGDLHVPFGFSADSLASVMLLVVTGVGTIIHVYSIGYMKDDPGYSRFFAYLNLFMAAMLVLVLADNVVLMFLGWEGVGLCSYLLIGFWYKDLANCKAGMKAFVVNRIGDFGFILGVFLIFVTFGGFDFAAINAAAATKPQATLFWIALCLFVGATGKSAQIPLYVWLPDAMAGPTPVSALIHAATMVTSGVYLLARLRPLFEASGALPIVAVMGTLTALLAAMIALTQTDIKKVLAYSTVSQLGYMFLAAGVGAFNVAVFHLVTHAFFKALLFLGAGAVIHSLHHEQDMRKMGGLLKRIPLTGAVFLCGALALSGFPLTAGFFSKDEILHEAHERGWTFLYLIGIATAILTAFYTFRQFCLVFLGEYRGEHRGEAEPTHGHADPGHSHGHEIHESPLSMMLPLCLLAGLALGGGFLAVPHFLEGAAAHEAASGQLTGWVLGGSAAVAGILAALVAFAWRPALRKQIAEDTAFGKAFSRLSYNKFYVDEFYGLLVVKPFEILSLLLFQLVDRILIDMLLVGGAGFFVKLSGHTLRRLQTGRIPAYVILFVVGVLGILTLVALAAS